MKRMCGFFPLLPVVFILIPRGAASQAWETGAGAQFTDAANQIKDVNAAALAQRDEIAKKALGMMKKLNDLIGAARQRGETIDFGKYETLADQIESEDHEGSKAFGDLSAMVGRENSDEIQAEAKSFGIPIDAYLDSGKAPIWNAFSKKIADLKSKEAGLSPDRLFAEYFKYANRLTMQKGRFVADNELEAEAAFAHLEAEVFDKLGLPNLHR